MGNAPSRQTEGLAAADALSDTLPSTPECFTDDQVLQLLEGDGAMQRQAVEHLERCETCQVLFAAVAGALQDGAPLERPSGIFRPGDLIAERYRIESFIARGGMGEVYAVLDSVLEERVALKTVRAASSDDEKAIRRLKSEVQLARKIGHPNTCRIYEFGEHTDVRGVVTYFFTMGLIQGETLGAKLRRDGALDPALALAWTRQILGGMAEAHDLGILHRDLKSDNIMLRQPRQTEQPSDAVIMDFGLALPLSSGERLTSDRHALIGSAAYMAPEQVEGLPLTAAADIYALGVIAFEMLTGQLPFRGASSAATALQRLYRAAPAPSSLRKGLDPRWDAFVLACLQRAPAERLASARLALAELNAFDAEDSISPLATTQLESRRSKPIRVASALVLLLVPALAGGWMLVRHGARESVQLQTGAPLRSAEELHTPRDVSSSPAASSAPAPALSPPPPATAQPAAAEPISAPRTQRARSRARNVAPPNVPATPSPAPAPVPAAGATPAASTEPVLRPSAPVAPTSAEPAGPLGPLPIDHEYPKPWR